MIKNIANMYADIILEIGKSLLPIVIIILVITIIKIVFDYIKYGKKAFSVFAKKEDINIKQESLKMLVDGLDIYYKMIQNNDTIILILESGIYVIYLLDYDGMISGNIKDEKLIFGKNTSKQRLIDNPIYVLKAKINVIKEKTNYDSKGYILIKQGSFNVLNRTDIEIISIKSFYYHFSKLIKNKKLSIEEINKIYEKIG